MLPLPRILLAAWEACGAIIFRQQLDEVFLLCKELVGSVFLPFCSQHNQLQTLKADAEIRSQRGRERELGLCTDHAVLHNHMHTRTYTNIYTRSKRSQTLTGEGVLHLHTRDVYRGEFVEHRICGQGTMSYANEDRSVAWRPPRTSLCSFCTTSK
jgi:hypothetical protein